MVNVGVSVGILFIKGLILLFIFYGGFSLLIMIIVIGVFLWIDFEIKMVIK